MAAVMTELFDGAELDKIIAVSFTAEEKEIYLNRIKEYTNDGIEDFEKYLFEPIKEKLIEDEDEKMMPEVMKSPLRKEQIKYILASSIAVIGLIALLLILTMRIETKPYINNTFTCLAFLAVILNLLLKEYYKANSLKKQNEEKNKILSDLSKHLK